MPWSNRPRCQAQNQNPRKGNIKGKDPGINKEPYTGLIDTNTTVERSLSIHESRNLKQARSYTTRMLTCYASIALATPSRDIVVIISCCWYKVKQFVKINADNIVFSKYGNNGKKENSLLTKSNVWCKMKKIKHCKTKPMNGNSTYCLFVTESRGNMVQARYKTQYRMDPWGQTEPQWTDDAGYFLLHSRGDGNDRYIKRASLPCGTHVPWWNLGGTARL